MEDFWNIIRDWNDGIGQALFLIIIISMLFGTVKAIFYYGVVALRGWPPKKKNVSHLDTKQRQLNEDK